ncbi:DUF4231 domain-containing protein [Gymnodinialimonas hymeniacidonis]|uniref:DUF4231 domain-containing protein n=1 Tax=Gymnodinialimonas hymeniacidonis TaxID=3126508 RepID=UPI0034C6925B
MRHQDYPALFLDADNASNQFQRNFLLLVFGEYLALFLAAVFSMNFLDGVVYHILFAGVFFVGLIVLISRALSKPDQWWYRCRALAESVKTLTWRYMMHAAPFDGSDPEAKREFREQLNTILRENLETAKRITDDWSGSDQITATMDAVRSKCLEERASYYMEHRISEQRDWYRKKAGSNRVAARRWVFLSGVCYVAAGSAVLSRIAHPDFTSWPIEPLIVVAASIVGWVQIKKYNELSAAYTVTAHEIGLIPTTIDTPDTDDLISEFVNDAEQAFSREHTLWLARQSD